MPRFLVMVKATKQSEAGVMPEVKMFEEMGRFNDELAAAGILRDADGLQPSSKGARIRFSKDGKQKTVVDGPFAETKEIVAGFWIWECKSQAEAVAWAKRCPSPHPGQECEIEVRQVNSFEDLGPAFTEARNAAMERRKAKVKGV